MHPHKISELNLRRSLLLMGLMVALAFLPGCLMLPVPNSRVEGSGVASQVVDATTGRGIPCAKIVDKEHPECRTQADETGHFRIEPYVQWHAGYLYSATSYPIWPFTVDANPRHRSLTIAAPGYLPTSFYLSDEFPPRDGANDNERQLFALPPLPLKPVQSATQASTTQPRSTR